jgi:hypothetical protein
VWLDNSQPERLATLRAGIVHKKIKRQGEPPLAAGDGAFMTACCLVVGELSPTGRGCLCKNAHTTTRRDCRSDLSFFVRNARYAPFQAIHATMKDNKWWLVMNTTKDALKTAPGYKYDKDSTMWVSDKS